MRESRSVGIFALARTRTGQFSQREVELVQTFADQAVIAIENVRLFNETQESLARQAATTEILEVVNSSPGNLTPVFDAILEKATLLSNSAFGALAIHNGDDMHQIVAMRGMPAEFPDFLRGPVRLGPETGLGRLVRGESFVHIIDAADDEAYRLGNPVLPRWSISPEPAPTWPCRSQKTAFCRGHLRSIAGKSAPSRRT